jgi:hypothetical protein
MEDDEWEGGRLLPTRDYNEAQPGQPKSLITLNLPAVLQRNVIIHHPDTPPPSSSREPSLHVHSITTQLRNSPMRGTTLDKDYSPKRPHQSSCFRLRESKSKGKEAPCPMMPESPDAGSIVLRDGGWADSRR